MTEWASYLAEIRVPATRTDWQVAFEADLAGSSWILEDGVVYKHSKWGEAIGLYEYRAPEAVVACYPLAANSHSCPYVGPRRGFVAWTLVPNRSSEARRLGLDIGRAGRGIVVDRACADERGPRVHSTITLSTIPVDAARWGLLWDVRQFLKHLSDVLISDEPDYLAYVRDAIGARVGEADATFWAYAQSFTGTDCYLFE